MGDELAGRLDGTLRVGVVGAGFIGEVHAKAARRAGARVVAVAASSPSSSKSAADRFGAERSADDGHEVVTADDIDVVHICTPNHLHRPLAEAALAAGKHVICEKPLATDLVDATRLLDTARTAGVVATVPFVYRFYPMVREARARAADGFGPVNLVHGSYLQDWLSTEDDDNWRVDAATSGRSRAFADIGSHWCDLVEFVTGDRIASLNAELVTAIPRRVSRGPHAHAFSAGNGPAGDSREVDTEDAAVVTFRTAAGVAGSVLVSQISTGHKNQLRFEVTGADATMAFDQEHPETLWLGRRGASTTLVRDDAYLSPSAAPYSALPPGHPQGYQDCFDSFVADTYRAIAAGSTDAVDGLPTFGDGARAVAITDAVLRSSTERTWVDVDPAPATQEGSS